MAFWSEPESCCLFEGSYSLLFLRGPKTLVGAERPESLADYLLLITNYTSASRPAGPEHLPAAVLLLRNIHINEYVTRYRPTLQVLSMK